MVKGDVSYQGKALEDNHISLAAGYNEEEPLDGIVYQISATFGSAKKNYAYAIKFDTDENIENIQAD